MKHKKLFIITALVVVSVCTVTAVAYFTSMGELNNKFLIGRNDIEIQEQYEPPKEMVEGDNIFTKEVQFENTGNVDCYIRAFMDFSDSDVKKSALLSQYADGDIWTEAEKYQQTPPENWEYISLDDDKLLGGYYYYTIPLKPGEKTNYLLRRVNVQFKTASQVQAFDIIVSAESVQTTDKDGTSFTDYKKCWNEFMGRRKQS